MIRRAKVIWWIGAVLLATLVLALSPLALITGCSKAPESASSSATGQVITPEAIRSELGGAYAGDVAYAQVSSTWLRAYYSDFRAELFRQGVTKWDERFDCNHFATYYVALAQTKFYLANFHSRTPAQTLALGTFWYQAPAGGHAIVVAFTERGLLFIEPQTGGEVVLTPAQRASAWLKAF